jgi:CPA1 family monovalent cation:H+ antiporter
MSQIFQEPVIAIALIGVVALLCQWLAWWVKLPAILFLLLSGILLGPALNIVDPDALLGDLLFPFVSLSVALILFEGALTLRLEEIRGLERVVRNLVTIGMLSTWLIVAASASWFLGFSWQMALLFGAIMVVTGPTVIVPMLRTVRPNAKISNILRWEGIVIDPIGALLAVLVFEFILASSGEALSQTISAFVLMLTTGIVLGVLSGYLLGILLRRHWLPEYLHNFATLAMVFAVFALSNTLHEESGLLTVTVMGIWLANMRGVNIEDILDFKENLSVLLISTLFIILAARIEFDQLTQLGLGAGLVFLSLQFIARPLKILLSTLGSSLTWRERGLLAWIAPRGIVAAAISALFSLRLEAAGYAQADMLVPLTFLMIVGTVVLQSASARLIARLLGVAEPSPRGILIVGANQVARAIGKALTEAGFRTVLADTYWDNVRTARMEGLSTYYGNPTSQHADRHLDLVGIGMLFSLSPQSDLNALATMRFKPEFGKSGVFSLPSKGEAEEGADKASAERIGRTLFGMDVTYSRLSGLLGDGAEIHSTTLTDSFGYDDFLARFGDEALPLFAITPRENLRVFTAEDSIKPGSGWTLLYLFRTEEEQEPQEAILESPEPVQA